MSEQPTDSQCIFCRIVAGEVPAYKLHEDQHILAFLDLGPLSRGHTLIIPKGHWKTLDQVPAEVTAAIGRWLPAMSRAVMEATGGDAWNILQNNGKAAHQAVDHVHFHIIPKFSDSGLEIGWPAGKLDEDEAPKLREAIQKVLT